MFNLFRNKTKIEELKKEFHFMVSDFGYKLIKEEVNDLYKRENLLVYHNSESNKQIEINADRFLFIMIIRKIENGCLPDYSDHINNIGILDLALIGDPSFNQNNYSPLDSLGVKGVAKNVKKLFYAQKEMLTTNNWIDIKKVEELKNEKYRSIFKRVTNNKPDFFIDKVRQLMESNFPQFQLNFDTAKLPSYHKDSNLEKLEYEKENIKVKIRQDDWRDHSHIYEVYIDDTKVKEVDSNKKNALEEIRKVCNNV